MTQEKNRLIKELKRLIQQNNSWFTPNDQDIINQRIDELSQLIDERLKSYGKLM